MTLAAIAKTIDNFNYVTSAVLTPMFLVAGTFFPISNLPAGDRRRSREINPLYHCVQLVRDVVAAGGSSRCRPRRTPAVLLAFALADVAAGDLAAAASG